MGRIVYKCDSCEKEARGEWDLDPVRVPFFVLDDFPMPRICGGCYECYEKTGKLVLSARALGPATLN